MIAQRDHASSALFDQSSPDSGPQFGRPWRPLRRKIRQYPSELCLSHHFTSWKSNGRNRVLRRLRATCKRDLTVPGAIPSSRAISSSFSSR